MVQKVLRTCVWVGVLALCLVGTTPGIAGSITISASVGGTPLAGTYANFDNLTLGDPGGVSSGITVSFSGDAQAVQDSLSGVYAAPYLSNSNGALFGDSSNGPDTTTYLATGTGSVTLALPGEATYVGLLWGSVDNYNSLSLYDGSTLVETITGTDVTASASGDQSATGTYYVNITSTMSFDRVVASSTSNAFEFDNVAFGTAVPEPSSIVLGLCGGIGVLVYTIMRRRGVVGGKPRR